MANPPFNVDDVSLATVEKDPRFNTYGIPRNKTRLNKKEEGKETVPNGNYLWISPFATSLKPQGRAAQVMANSASDARHSEADASKKALNRCRSAMNGCGKIRLSIRCWNRPTVP